MPVCIAGMHRSGTSMVTEMLHQAGLALGPADRLMPATEDNPEGFWEHLGFVEINEALLTAAGGAWDFPPPPDFDWSSPKLAPLRTRAEALVAEFDGAAAWGWKDPRNCLTLPFWQRLAPALTVVFVVRNPLEVAFSLKRRNHFSFPLNIALWDAYAQRALAATTPEHRVVTHFDAYFARPGAELRRVLGRLGIEPPADLTDAVASAEADLKHHRLTIGDLYDAEISPAIIDRYRALCADAEWFDPGDPLAAAGASEAEPRLEKAGRERFSIAIPPWSLSPTAGAGNRAALEWNLFRLDLDDHRQALAGRTFRVQELEDALAAQQAQRGELEHRVGERDRKLAELGAAYQRIVNDMRTLRETLHGQRNQLAAAEEQAAMQQRYEAELREMLASAQAQLLDRDTEVIATLGAALARHAPGAPSAIYYRQVLDRVRTLVAERLPAGAPVLVATFGDDAMLALDGRPARSYPQGDGGVT
ncbi:MAG TPA: sulfotransferase, partial [Thermomicrobiales bacterium]|nr:sulfotransferase [Thermomicrobiales bacterium]